MRGKSDGGKQGDTGRDRVEEGRASKSKHKNERREPKKERGQSRRGQRKRQREKSRGHESREQRAKKGVGSHLVEGAGDVVGGEGVLLQEVLDDDVGDVDDHLGGGAEGSARGARGRGKCEGARGARGGVFRLAGGQGVCARGARGCRGYGCI